MRLLRPGGSHHRGGASIGAPASRLPVALASTDPGTNGPLSYIFKNRINQMRASREPDGSQRTSLIRHHRPVVAPLPPPFSSRATSSLGSASSSRSRPAMRDRLQNIRRQRNTHLARVGSNGRSTCRSRARTARRRACPTASRRRRHRRCARFLGNVSFAVRGRVGN